MNLQKYSSDQWVLVAEDMHLSVFGEHRPKDLNRVDFALVCWDEKPLGYFTCREFDSESVYIGFGGFIEKSFKNVNAYKLGLDYLRSNYKRATTLVENTNISMIKLAMSQGFLITGIKNFKNIILLELSQEF